MKPIKPILYPDHPLYTDAVKAVKSYHEALASSSPASEVERLRQIAESQFQALNDYQLQAMGCHSQKAH